MLAGTLRVRERVGDRQIRGNEGQGGEDGSRRATRGDTQTEKDRKGNPTTRQRERCQKRTVISALTARGDAHLQPLAPFASVAIVAAQIFDRKEFAEGVV